VIDRARALVSAQHEYNHLFDIYVPIALGVFAVILLAMVVAVVRYRARPPEKAARWHDHHLLEGTYALVLVLTVAFLLYETFTVEHRIDTVANRERPAVTIDVVASRWEWTFYYPRYHITVRSGSTGNATFVVPAGQAVRFELTTVDVIHAFWIPALRYKHDNTPGSTQPATLTFDHAGLYPGQCAEYCGLNHSEMVFTARAVSPSRFAAWAQRGGKGAP
jgi:cytochrome c oxidase subunit 2